MSNWAQLTEDSRRRIDYAFNTGKKSMREIAKEIGVSVNTISREIHLGKTRGADWAVRNYCRMHNLRMIKGAYFYRWKDAEEKAIKRKSNSHKWNKIENNIDLRDRIIKDLTQNQWKPDIIAGRMKSEGITGKDYACTETIYAWIYEKQNEKLKKYLGVGKRKAHKIRGHKKRNFSQIKHRVSIDKRPKEIDMRKEFGHYEGDSIVSKNHSSGEALNTIVERKTRKIFATKITKKTADLTLEAMRNVFLGIPEFARKSITLDNGTEFSLHYKLKEKIGIETFFAHPYSSWERGTNERHNGLIRRHYPKKIDFKNVSENDLEETIEYFNNLPRKILGYKTPNEVWEEEIQNSS